MCLKIAVVDGMGGGLGKAICEKIAHYTNKNVKLYALGTNSHATVAMLKAGACDGATGENAICHMAQNVDVIVGPMAILVANSMMGEITPKMAARIAESNANKILLPLQKCNMIVAGVKDLSIKEMLDEIDKIIEERIPKL